MCLTPNTPANISNQGNIHGLTADSGTVEKISVSSTKPAGPRKRPANSPVENLSLMHPSKMTRKSLETIGNPNMHGNKNCTVTLQKPSMGLVGQSGKIVSNQRPVSTSVPTQNHKNSQVCIIIQ